jgi:exonuclease III
MMNQDWIVLCWNVHGINDGTKWKSIRNKIEESACNIICLQETKSEQFDLSYVRNFAPKRFDKFDFCPLKGAFGGTIVI